MKFWGFFLLVGITLGCSSPHPITEAPYIDLSTGVDGVVIEAFPAAVVDSLGWTNLASAGVRKFGEEFQIAIISDTKPFHLFRISKSRKNPGETVLFWPIPDESDALTPEQNMQQYLNGMCEEFEVAGDYEYCVPKFSREANWARTFSILNDRNAWSAPDGSVLEQDSEITEKNWRLIFQARAGRNYRIYEYRNPEMYRNSEEAVDVLAISAQLRQIANNFTPARNLDVFTGITTGVKGSEFIPCGSNERWRFDGELSELINENGLPFQIEEQDSLRFLLKLDGTLRDEWYAQRSTTGFAKILTPSHINSFSVTSATSCQK